MASFNLNPYLAGVGSKADDRVVKVLSAGMEVSGVEDPKVVKGALMW